jgi:hypothetical protein
VLTVIGYSVMDTIVILDRIRENVKIMADEPYDKIVNVSILQTMTRSLNTLATVVITLVALLAFGGASLQNFAFALLVGICSGGYHSIFYSAPLVAVLRDRQLKRQAQGRGTPERPRTVAEARAQAQASRDRAEIIASRKERREREKSKAAPRSTAPARYRKKRTGPATPEEIAADELLDRQAIEESVEHEHPIEHEHGIEHDLDPLDAQRAGLHDTDLGHEEIKLTLDEEPPAPAPAPKV